MKKILTILSLCASISQAAELPVEVNRGIQKFYPKAKILSSTSCRIGDPKVDSYGLLVDSNTAGKNPLRALVAHKSGKKWQVNDLGRKISNSKGMVSDFLSEFWSTKGFVGRYQIRCTTPTTDADVNTQANGEFSKEFAKIDGATLHLCFQASNVYNSWECLTYDPTIENTRVSFVQLNAD